MRYAGGLGWPRLSGKTGEFSAGSMATRAGFRITHWQSRPSFAVYSGWTWRKTAFILPILRDSPLPIAASQTISQPYIVALMTAALELKPGDRVLEIGTGSGYAAAILAEIAGEVYSVERHKILADTARQRLADLGYTNVQVLHGDGTLGWQEQMPFDGIIVAAASPEVPASLKQQLAMGGRLVIPVGSTLQTQKLLRIRRISDTEYSQEDLGEVRFVPLIGAAGWDEPAKKGPGAIA